MKRITAIALLITLMLTAATAFALPKPRTAHYPRGGRLTLSPLDQINNTYAFKATGKTDGRVQLHISNAYSDAPDTEVFVQMFVVNRWGNWVAFGSPQVITVGREPSSHDLYFTIRPRKPFCIVVSAYGVLGNVVIPYLIVTD